MSHQIAGPVLAVGHSARDSLRALHAFSGDPFNEAYAAEVSRWVFPSDGLWQGVVYGLEPPAAALLALGAFAIRRTLGKRIIEEAPTLDGLSVVVLMVFAIPLMDGVVAQALERAK